MRFEATAVDGAFVVVTEALTDERGSFARTFCAAEFAAAGIDFTPVQSNLSRNPSRSTLRGLHSQAGPHAEAKLVQCVGGRIFDVAVDLRPASPTYRAHATVELDSSGERLFFIPPGCAHGFLTLTDDAAILYQMGTAFVPGVGIGVRWDDPGFGIVWPNRPALISARDASYADWQP